MNKIFKPDTPEQLTEIIQWANAHKTPLKVQGSASKTWIGHPVNTEHVLDLSGFSGISEYQPNELVLTAGAGTPLAEIEQVLADNRQMLAFEPSDYSALFPGASLEKRGTLGGVLAGNISGPRRFYSGAARDHFLGFRAVSGRGEPFKSGGRVVKNVTGFDLSKLMAGSWGTLAACWEVTIKVLPMPEQTSTLLLFGLSDEEASRCMSIAAASPNNISGASYLPAALAKRSAVPSITNDGAQTSLTALRIEGPEPSVVHRNQAVQKLLTGGNHSLRPKHVTTLNREDSQVFWSEIGNLHFLSSGFLTSSTEQQKCSQEIWRLSVPPAAGWQVARDITKAITNTATDKPTDACWFSDQAGGLVWLTCSADVPEQQLRAALKPWGGHATLWCLSNNGGNDDDKENTERRTRLSVFQPQTDALTVLTQKVKRSFDPNKVLNPGRMYADI